MAAPNVEWITSQKGKPQLVVDGYMFTCNGKGKAVNVRYWVCASGCSARAKTEGNRLVELNGVVNPPDHGHVNDTATLMNVKLKVCINLLVCMR